MQIVDLHEYDAIELVKTTINFFYCPNRKICVRIEKTEKEV